MSQITYSQEQECQICGTGATANDDGLRLCGGCQPEYYRFVNHIKEKMDIVAIESGKASDEYKDLRKTLKTWVRIPQDSTRLYADYPVGGPSLSKAWDKPSDDDDGNTIENAWVK